MSRKLLTKAINSVPFSHCHLGLKNEIEEYLAKPEPEPEPVDGVVLRDGFPALLMASTIRPTDVRLYTHPPKQQPLKPSEYAGFRDGLDRWSLNKDEFFKEGVRFAERYHGIDFR